MTDFDRIWSPFTTTVARVVAAKREARGVVRHGLGELALHHPSHHGRPVLAVLPAAARAGYAWGGWGFAFNL
jgi:hypothetical protein